jgi:hypothetical protein
VTPLERRCRWLLLTYPAWYRRRRGEEMLGTLLEASPPGGRWPSFRDARALVTGGLRVRGWTWSLSMLWVVAGIVGTGYDFCVAWLVLGAVMTWILAVPAHPWKVPGTSSRPGDEASRWPPGADDLQTS